MKATDCASLSEGVRGSEQLEQPVPKIPGLSQREQRPRRLLLRSSTTSSGTAARGSPLGYVQLLTEPFPQPHSQTTATPLRSRGQSCHCRCPAAACVGSPNDGISPGYSARPFLRAHGKQRVVPSTIKRSPLHCVHLASTQRGEANSTVARSTLPSTGTEQSPHTAPTGHLDAQPGHRPHGGAPIASGRTQPRSSVALAIRPHCLCPSSGVASAHAHCVNPQVSPRRPRKR